MTLRTIEHVEETIRSLYETQDLQSTTVSASQWRVDAVLITSVIVVADAQPMSIAFANRNLSDYRPAPVPGSGSPATGRASPAPGPAPARPARSVRRAPDPPAQAPGSFPSILPVTSLPTSESSKSTPQPTLLQIPPANNDYDLPVSPISPMDGPQRIQPSSTTTWESERNQRSHLLQAQQQNVERENKLQNAVKAFSAGSKGKAPERSALRKPSGANGSRLHDELMIGHGGRDFDDVDCELPSKPSQRRRLR